MVPDALAAGVGRLTISMIAPFSSTTPAAILVPPTSTPMVRLIVRGVRSIVGGLGGRRLGRLNDRCVGNRSPGSWLRLRLGPGRRPPPPARPPPPPPPRARQTGRN